MKKSDNFYEFLNLKKKKLKIEKHYFQRDLLYKLSEIPKKLIQAKSTFNELVRKKFNFNIYIFGKPGGGKTFIINCFLIYLETINLKKLVLRTHFQEFMHLIHSEINLSRKKKINNPLKKISKKISKKYKLICFDELEIIDIADAMIVSNVFRALHENGTNFLITSNFHPDSLYKNGLQREQFLPFILFLHENMELLEIKNDKDLRKSKEEEKSSYYFPLNKKSSAFFEADLKKINKKKDLSKKIIYSMGRKLILEKTSDNLMLCNFTFICSFRFSANDYINLAKLFDWFFIDKIPNLGRNKLNEARRFITLIDILYENKSNLVIMAEKKISEIFDVKIKELPYSRTTSRIYEMTKYSKQILLRNS